MSGSLAEVAAAPAAAPVIAFGAVQQVNRLDLAARHEETLGRQYLVSSISLALSGISIPLTVYVYYSNTN